MSTPVGVYKRTRRWLASVLRGHYVLRPAEQPGSTWRLYEELLRILYRELRRRSQRRLTSERYARLALPTSHITQARTVVAY